MKFSIKRVTAVALVASATLITACSFDVVEPATKGKILGTAGYQKGVLEPGKYTLWGRDKMITLQTSTKAYTEKVDVILKDKLKLTVDVKFRGRIAGDPQTIDSMFNDIAAGEDDLIVFNEVYSIYGRMAIRNITRAVVSQYTVEDVHKNYTRLSSEIGKQALAAMVNTPIEVSDLALGLIEYPAVITDAINAAKQRDLAIKKEEAQARIDMVRKENEQVMAKADYEIEITKAKTTRDANKILGASITPQLLDLKRLEALRLMASNQNAVFMPVEAMSSTGAQIRMFGK